MSGKTFFAKIKKRLFPFAGFSPFSLFSSYYTHPNNYGQKYTFYLTLIANLILMVMQRRLERKWSFSGLATMVRIALMYYVDFYSLFNNPEKDWENMAVFDEISPHQLTLF